jgi:hypothetical protein
MRNISVGKSTLSLNVGHEKEEELEVIDDHSDWKVKTKAVQRRAKGWMSRFQRDMRRGGRVQRASDQSDDLLARTKSLRSLHLAQTAAERPRRQMRPDKPRLDVVSDLQPFPAHMLKAFLCIVCFDNVGIDYERVSCQHCPVVAHR